MGRWLENLFCNLSMIFCQNCSYSSLTAAASLTGVGSSYIPKQPAILLSPLYCLGWFKSPVSCQTDGLTAGTKFSDYLGLKHYKKAKENKHANLTVHYITGTYFFSRWPEFTVVDIVYGMY